MEIIITQWALDSYLELRAENVFTTEEYKKGIRRDVLRLQAYPNAQNLSKENFGQPAQDRNGEVITNGYKMKWHQMATVVFS